MEVFISLTDSDFIKWCVRVRESEENKEKGGGAGRSEEV